MKPVYYIVLAIVGSSLVVRVIRWRRRHAERRPGRHPLLLLQRRGLFGDTGLVAGREIHERLRGRLFKVITLVLLAVVGAAIVIPTIHKSPSTQEIGVVGSLPPSLRHDLVAGAEKAGLHVSLVNEGGIAQARTALRAGSIALVVDGRRAVIVKTPIATSDTTTVAQAARVIASALGIDNALQAAHVSPSQAAVLSHARPLPVKSLEAGTTNGTAKSTSVIGLVLVFIMLTQYNTWTLMGVMEEKSSRVVEVLLATVRPIQLLAGKVLGIGLVALVQAGLVVAFALVLAKAVGSDLLHGTAPLVLVATLVWLVLGYAFYSWVYAAAGSMAERQDQVQSLALPLSLPIIFGYVVALTAASSPNPSLLVKVLAYLPPTAPFGMPVLVGSDHVTWWAFLLAVLLSIASTVAVARVAAGVYRRAVLRTGGRVRVGELLASRS